MKDTERQAIVVCLARHLDEAGSWCGETHLQKATFLLQEMCGVPTGYNYILYKHGPFSFDLRDELGVLRAEGVLALVIRKPEYGPAITPTARSRTLESAAEATLDQFKQQMKFVADAVEKKGVMELERVATALYLFMGHGKAGAADAQAVANRIREIKPHVSEADASSASEQVAELISKAKSFGWSGRA